ncbi:MAG: hypothetical protein ACK559_28720, partial [bacterium]
MHGHRLERRQRREAVGEAQGRRLDPRRVVLVLRRAARELLGARRGHQAEERQVLVVRRCRGAGGAREPRAGERGARGAARRTQDVRDRLRVAARVAVRRRHERPHVLLRMPRAQQRRAQRSVDVGARGRILDPRPLRRHQHRALGIGRTPAAAEPP